MNNLNHDQKNKDIKLSQEEKGAIRNSLISYMESHPLSSPISPSPYSFTVEAVETFSTFSSWKGLVTSTLLFAICIVSGGGTLLAAEKALPGEPLYLVKRNVSEGLYSLILFDERARAEFEASLIDKRLEEGVKLSEEGKLTEETRENLEKSIAIHAEKATDLIKSSEADASSVFLLENQISVARLEGAVEAKQQILASLPIESLGESIGGSLADSSGDNNSETENGGAIVMAQADKENSSNSSQTISFDSFDSLHTGLLNNDPAARTALAETSLFSTNFNQDGTPVILEPHVRSLNDSDEVLLEDAAFDEIEKIKVNFDEAQRLMASLEKNDPKKALLQKTLSDLQNEVDSLIRKVQISKESGKENALREIISISEQLQTYIEQISRIESLPSASTSSQIDLSTDIEGSR